MINKEIEKIRENEKYELEVMDYFDYVKSKQKENTNENLEVIYNKSLELLTKYKKTGQINGMKKLIFMLESVEKEMLVLERGYSTYVDKEDVQEYIDTVQGKVIKVIEVERYEREIPDEIVENMMEVKDLFDDFYVVFTDYTGEIEKQVEKERREKDPILFGVFYNEADNELMDRMYFIGDWEDEYCDLTLSKMVSEMAENNNKDIEKDLLTDGEIAELKKMLIENDQKNVTIGKKESLIDKIKKFFR